MMKRLSAIMLAILLALSVVPLAAAAENTPPAIGANRGFENYPQDAKSAIENMGGDQWSFNEGELAKVFPQTGEKPMEKGWFYAVLPGLNDVAENDRGSYAISVKNADGQPVRHFDYSSSDGKGGKGYWLKTTQKSDSSTLGPTVFVGVFDIQDDNFTPGHYTVQLMNGNETVGDAVDLNLGRIHYLIDGQTLMFEYGIVGNDAHLNEYTSEDGNKRVSTWMNEANEPCAPGSTVKFPQGTAAYVGTLVENKPLVIDNVVTSGEYGVLWVDAFFNQDADFPEGRYHGVVTKKGDDTVIGMHPFNHNEEHAQNQAAIELSDYPEGEFPFTAGQYTLKVYEESALGEKPADGPPPIKDGAKPICTKDFTLSDVITNMEVLTGHVNLWEEDGQVSDSIKVSRIDQNPRKIFLSGKVISKDDEEIKLTLVGTDARGFFMSGTRITLAKDKSGKYVAKEDGGQKDPPYLHFINTWVMNKGNNYAIDATGVVNIDADVAAAPPEVNTGAGVNAEDEDVKSVLDALKPSEDNKSDGVKIADDSQEALEEGANKAVESLTAQQIKNAKDQAKTELKPTEGTEVRIVVQTSLDIVLKDVKAESDKKSIVINITPVVQVVATTAGEKENINLTEGEGKNAVVISGGQKKEMTVTKPVTLEIPLPANYFSKSQAFVKHTAKTGTYFYTGTITNNILSFLNPHGFSEFEISAESGAAAEVTTGEDDKNPVGYASVAEAIANGSGKTVTIKDAEAIKNGVTVSGSVNNVTIKLPEGVSSIKINGKTYTVKELESPIEIKGTGSTSNPGGNGGSGTTPPAQISTTVTPAISGTKAVAEVSANTANTLVQGAKQGNASEVVVKVTVSTAGIDTVEVSLPANSVSALGQETKADLSVETPVADITLPNESLTALGNGASKVTVSATRNSDETTSITVKKDNTVVNTLSKPMKATIPAEGAASSTVAVLVDDKGFETVIPKSIYGDGEMKLLLGGSAKIKLKDNAKTFDDTQGHWAETEGAIGFVSSRELFKGTSNTSFSPEQTMTRGMMVTVLHRLESTPKGGSANFGDVASDAYYAEAVAWGAQNKIVEGKGENLFAPDDNVTREQLATFLYRYASTYGVSTAGRASLAGFGDGSNVSGFAKDAMEWCVHAGFIKGQGNGRLNPGGNATRAEVAAILMRFVKFINQ